MPVGVYDVRASVGAGFFFTFGGHLCTETKGNAPYFYTNAVQRLELAKSVKVPASACRVATEVVVNKAKAALAAGLALDAEQEL